MLLYVCHICMVFKCHQKQQILCCKCCSLYLLFYFNTLCSYWFIDPDVWGCLTLSFSTAKSVILMTTYDDSVEAEI